MILTAESQFLTFSAVASLLSASDNTLLKDPGLIADHAPGRSLQEVHRTAGQRQVKPRQHGEDSSYGDVVGSLNVGFQLSHHYLSC